MKINQILSERISLSSAIPDIEHFIVSIFQQETTNQKYDYSKKAPYGTTGLQLDAIGIVALEHMFDKHGFSQLLIEIARKYLEVDSHLTVKYGKNSNRVGSALTSDYSQGYPIYTLVIDYLEMEHLVTSYRNEVLGKLYRIDDTWIDESESQGMTAERGKQLIQMKDDIIAKDLPYTTGCRHFISAVIHELTHLRTDHLAYLKYKKDDRKILGNRSVPHLISRMSTYNKLRYNDSTKKGLDVHFANPAELDSYAQEISTKIRYAIANGNELPVKYVRQQLSKLVRKYRNEVELNLHNLTPKQQKYVYKLYKRVYQEIEDMIYQAANRKRQ